MDCIGSEPLHGSTEFKIVSKHGRALRKKGDVQ